MTKNMTVKCPICKKLKTENSNYCDCGYCFVIPEFKEANWNIDGLENETK